MFRHVWKPFRQTRLNSMQKPMPLSTLANLEQYLELEKVSENVYSNVSTLRVPFGGRGIFGGTLVAQSLYAALLNVDEKFRPISMHCNFLVAANTKSRIEYHVETLRDGKNFCSRQVKAKQNDQLIFLGSISFRSERLEGSSGASDSPKFSHYRQAPIVGKDIPSPEDCHEQTEVFMEWAKNSKDNVQLQKLAKNPQQLLDSYDAEPCKWRLPMDMFDLSQVAPEEFDKVVSDRVLRYWVKSKSDFKSPRFNDVAIAYISDYFFLSSNMRLNMQEMFTSSFSVSLDHTIHFYDKFDIDEWLSFSIRSKVCQDDRALVTGEIYSEGGKLVATVLQEGLQALPAHAQLEPQQRRSTIKAKL
ncbi:BA75_02624T0 [Komagataella pastoris]|uniref:BA75_02624T0 n=1 Tax=Komagataella pastoris TaxID=4922 RepID=A0A1B2JCI0_PICPA|nr:BA75_02624T0 [Komagataella pastoris]